MTVGEYILMMMVVAFLMAIAHLMMGKLPSRRKTLALSPRKELPLITTQDDLPHFLIFFS